MSSVNKVIILGRIGRAADLRATQDGTQVANISVATGQRWKDKNSGEMIEKTEWHNVSLFGKLAEIVGAYTKKGDKIYIEGSLSTRSYVDKNTNETKYVTEIRGRDVVLLGEKGVGGGGQIPETAASNSYARKSAAVAELDDDVPF